MKKMLTVILALTMLLNLAACGGTASNQPGSSGGSNSSRGEGGDTPVYTITAGTESTEENLYYKTLAYFKEYVEEATGGAIAVKIYPNSELGDELSMLEQARSGNLDAVVVGGGNLASLVPELQLLSVPYLWNSFENFQHAMNRNSEVWKLLVDIVASKNAGVSLVAPTTIGSRWVANTKGEVNTPEDMKNLGITMRIQSNPTEAAVWSTFGANVTNMPMTDVFTAMQQGVVDAVENSPEIMYNYKIQENAKYFSATEHNWYFATVMAGDSIWERIPEEYHEAVKKAFLDAGEKVIEITPETQQVAIDKLAEEGAIITYDVDKEAFKNMIYDLYESVAAENGAEALLEACNAAQAG
jgi:tripartite ATP-independent transporter DctP family solute receptor